MGLFDKLQSKFEIYRLEQRYTRRRNRTHFATDAVYMDGEYVYGASAELAPPPANKAFSGGGGIRAKGASVRIREFVVPTRATAKVS